MTDRVRRFRGELRMCLKKKRYKSQEHAEQGINYVRKRWGAEMRAYLCPNCMYWHLTSKP
jgi:hypothetical protein